MMIECDAKEVLKYIRVLENQISINQTEIEEIKNKMRGCSAISYDPKIGSAGSQNTESAQAKYYPALEEHIRKLDVQVKRWSEYRDYILELVNQLELSQYRKVLYNRYFLYHSWEKIAVDMNYSYRGIHKVHGNALNAFNKILKECTQVHIKKW